MGYDDDHVDFFYLDWEATNPYGAIQCKSSQILRFFFFDPKSKEVTYWSKNMYTSDYVEFLYLDSLEIAYFATISSKNELKTIKLWTDEPKEVHT